MSEHEWYLIGCIAGTSLVTALLRVLPMMFLEPDAMPRVVLDWLSFVPVAIMAALVGTDIFFNQGALDISFNNLYLVAAVPSLLVAWWSKSFFGAIAFAMGFVALARFWGW
jgi:branched-subunit amino acid transport protein